MKRLSSYLQPILKLIVLLTMIVIPREVYAQAFETGYQAFLSGDYRRAKTFLTRGIKQTNDRYDQALMYKLLGITEYKLGSRQRAQANFKKAVQLDPAITITREESRDKKILQLFASTKRSSSARGSSVSRRGSGRGQEMRRTGRASARRIARSQRSGGRSMMSSRGGMMRQESNSGSLALNLLPFGVGQFQQGKTLLGASFAIGQALGLGLFFERNQTANQADQDALDVINEFESGASDISQEEFDDFLNQSETFVNAARQEATLGLILFGGLYVTSVLEAILNPPPAQPVMMRRRAAIEDAEMKLKPGEVLESIYFAEPTPGKDERMFRFHFDFRSGQPRGVVAVNYKFK